MQPAVRNLDFELALHPGVAMRIVAVLPHVVERRRDANHRRALHPGRFVLPVVALVELVEHAEQVVGLDEPSSTFCAVARSA